MRKARSDHLHYYARIMFHDHIFMTVITLFCVFHLQVAFMPYRVNGQYIMEGLASSFLFSMGGLGFIILDKSNAVGMSKLNRFLLLFLGFVCVLVSFFTCRVFMRMKLPWVLALFEWFYQFFHVFVVFAAALLVVVSLTVLKIVGSNKWQNGLF